LEPAPSTARRIAVAERIFVSIDLETTGLDASNDHIIEIGAVRFQGDRELERFTTLIKPPKSIPARITQITGIRNSDVADAPPIETVRPELLAFVGGDVAAVIAHSATFDIGFLRAAGIEFHRPVYDTLELAQILLPGLASYSLIELCQALNIDETPTHRALSDSLATVELFRRLWQQAANLAPTVHDLLLESAQVAGGWVYTQFFADTRSAKKYESPYRGAEDKTLAEPADVDAATQITEGSGPMYAIPEDELLSYFADDGPLASLLGSNFERRSGQVAMAAQAMHAFNVGDYLLIEAGTGTGKSLAYLLPASLFALVNRCRVVVATNTIALQDQLVQKDIPQVQALLAVRPPVDPYADDYDEPPVLEAAVLKGRQNYLCTRRLREWRANHALSAIELTVLAKVLVWLALIGEGDASDLVLNSPAERAIWARICSDAATCSQERCGSELPNHALNGGSKSVAMLGTRDFYWDARRRADVAHIVVVNHALLLADLMAGGRVLPPYRNLVVDETHRLEEAATDQMTYRVEWPAVQMLLRRVAPDGDLVGQITRMAERVDHDIARELTPVLAKQAERTSRLLARFAEQLTTFARNQEPVSRGESGFAQRLALDSSVRSQPDWSRIEVEWSEVRSSLAQLVKSIEQLVHELDIARWWEMESTATLFAELRELHVNCMELAHQLDEILLAPGGVRRARVAWMEGADNSASVTLAIAPLTVNEVLERDLLQRQRCAIFTGATLRTGSSFRYVRDRLGLWDVKMANVDSPFDYKRSTMLYLPSDVPLPNHPHYQQMVEQAIVEAATAAGGRTLVLFTSYHQLRATADAIRTPLERQGVSLFQHGQSSRFRLLREYRQAEQAVLLGTRSFWEGIDLPGEELTCLLIARLPFAVPNDPLVAARSAEFDDPFQEYTVPDAVLRFRQGFGRLIRRAADRGVIVLLDSRAWRKDYGSAFLDSLPECTVRRAPLQNLSREVRSWLGRPR
jgi:DNA polymerase-3 subunit epsilon/ATP-dependent DNA helicase DinG